MRPSRVLARLHQGHPVLFYALHFTDASVWELASLIGIDCLWLDLEHHGHTLETAAQLIRAARVGTSDVIARPAKGEWMRMQRMPQRRRSARAGPLVQVRPLGRAGLRRGRRRRALLQHRPGPVRSPGQRADVLDRANRRRKNLASGRRNPGRCRRRRRDARSWRLLGAGGISRPNRSSPCAASPRPPGPSRRQHRQTLGHHRGRCWASQTVDRRRSEAPVQRCRHPGRQKRPAATPPRLAAIGTRLPRPIFPSVVGSGLGCPTQSTWAAGTIFRSRLWQNPGNDPGNWAEIESATSRRALIAGRCCR